MNEIIITNKDGRLTVSSLQIATDFEKRHDNIIRDIENLLMQTSPQNCGDPLFIETCYQHPQNNQWYKYYELTRDGFCLLVMGFTGKKALEWKLRYIEAFNLMEQQLLNRNSNLEEIIAKTVAVTVSETIKALSPLLKDSAPAVAEPPVANEPKRIKKPYKYITPSKISMLPPELKQEVDDMIISGEYSCQQIANYIMNNSNIYISQMSINKYKRRNFI